MKQLSQLIFSVFAVFLAGAAIADQKQANAQAAMEVLDRFIATFSARDPVGHTATYHFPHYRLAGGTMSSWADRDVATTYHREQVFPNLVAAGWHRSEWVERTIVTQSDHKIHVATKFRRLRKDGSEIGTYDSLYVLVFADGRWGIKMRSSFLR